MQRGRGDSEETAKTEALAQIARFFRTTVNANLQTSIKSEPKDGGTAEVTSVVNDVSVLS